MDDRGDFLGGILADTFPDTHHVAAGSIDDTASMTPDLLDKRNGCTKSRYDHHIVRPEILDMGTTGGIEEVTYPKCGNLRIDLWIVNDLPNQEETGIRENLTRGIGQINGTLHAVAKPELLCQPDCRASRLKNGSSATETFDQRTMVMVFHLLLHPLHNLRCAEVDLGGGGGGAHRCVTEGCRP